MAKSRQEYRRELLSELRAILEGEGYEGLDMIERSRRIVLIWNALGLDDRHADYLTMLGIDSQTDHLPKGTVRKHWNKDALVRVDAESAECEEFFRDSFERARLGLVAFLNDEGLA